MADDFPADSSTTGKLAVGEAPFLLRSDFENDSDWVEVLGLKRYHDYEFRTLLPPDPLEPFSDFTFIWAEVYDGDENRIVQIQRTFEVPHNYVHRSKSDQHFIGFVPNTVGNYQVQVVEVDVAGDTRETAVAYRFNTTEAMFGSITSADDVDMYQVNFSANFEYEIDVFGDSSRSSFGTTLGNPLVRIFDQNQHLVADNNSGRGTDAKLTFQPTANGPHYISVSGLGTLGSYFLRIQDEHSDSQQNATPLTVGMTTLGNTDWAGDTDWLSFEAVGNFNYDFVSQSQFENLEIFDSEQNLIFHRPIFRPTTSSFSVGSSQTLYVLAKGNSEYQITPVLLDDHPAQFFERAILLPEGGFDSFVGSIEREDDRDIFNLHRLVKNTTVKFDLRPYGDLPLNDAYISVYNGNREVIGTYEAGSRIAFKVTGNDAVDPRHLLVYSAKGNIGNWALSQSYVDTPDSTSTGWNVKIEDNGRGRIVNVFEENDDVDYHRIRLRANTWYEIETDDVQNWSIERPNGTVVNRQQIFSNTVHNQARYYFRTLTEGDHYFVARNGSSSSPQSYTVGFRQNASFPSFHSPIGTRHTTDHFFRINNVFRFGLEHEIYSEIGLKTGDRFISANKLEQLAPGEAFVLEVNDVHAAKGDVYVRTVLADGSKLGWNKVSVIENLPLVNLDYRDYRRGRIRYSFNIAEIDEYSEATGLTGVEELSEQEKSFFRSVATQERVILDFEEQNSFAEILVFKADLGSDAPLLSFAPTRSQSDDRRSLASDIVINTGSNAFEAESPESVYRMLRALGTALGLPELDVDRTQSIMGTQVREGFESIYPSTFLTEDFEFLVPGSEAFRPEEYTSTYLRLNGDTSLVRGALPIRREERYSITATGSNDPVSIDLRGGGESFVKSDTVRVIQNGTLSYFDDGLGGFADDGLTGNATSNRLAGFGGNDVIRGEGGNDFLEGGLGDDYYVFTPAHNNDVIREASQKVDGGYYPSGGTDVIRFEGMHDHDSITEDFTFARLGNDLVIRLELNNQTNVNADSIRITDMDDPSRRVEAFALLNTNGFVDRISLASVFEQANENRRRFEVLASKDEFGSLVKPV